MNNTEMTTDLIDRIEEALNSTPAYDLFDDIYEIISSHQGDYSALVLYDTEKSEIIVEPISDGSVLHPDDPRILLSTIPGLSYPDVGLEDSDLFSDEELEELESLVNGEDAFLSLHPYPDFHERCYDGHYFYFVENGGWNDTVKNMLGVLRGKIQ